MGFLRSYISSLFPLSSIANTTVAIEPKQLKNCNGVYEFYGNPSPASNRGSGLRILFYIGKRKDILQCLQNSRVAKVAPLHEQLNSGRYSKIDEQLLRDAAIQLDIKDPYLTNGGI